MEIGSSYFTFIPQYIGKWNIYLQYPSGAEWKYYNPNGGNTPYIVLSGEALNSYIIIPLVEIICQKGNPVIRICVDEYALNGSRSTWSEPYQQKAIINGLIPAPNFDGFGSSVIELCGTLRPLISDHSFSKNNFCYKWYENSPITKQYKNRRMDSGTNYLALNRDRTKSKLYIGYNCHIL